MSRHANKDSGCSKLWGSFFTISEVESPNFSYAISCIFANVFNKPEYFFFSLRGDVAFSETAKQRKSYPERHQRCARFYRAMQYSAKRGITIASRPSVCRSVCPSVTLVNQDHIGWKSWKLIVRTISPKAIYLLPGEHGDILGRLEVGWEKLACWRTKSAISLKRVKIEEKLLWTERAYRNSSTLFRTIPTPTPYGLLFPKIGSSQPHPKFQSLLSQERVKLWTSNFVRTFIGSIGTKAR